MPTIPRILHQSYQKTEVIFHLLQKPNP